MGYKNDLDIIHCYIDFADNGNNAIFNREKIHKILAEEVIGCLEKYKLAFEIKPLGDKGGGARETFLNFLRLAWENKDIIAMLSVVIWKSPKYLVNFFRKVFDQEGPRIIIDLSLTSNQDFDYEKSEFQLGLRMINLKYLNDEICKIIIKKYPIFKLDQSFALFIEPYNFSIHYQISHKYQNTVNSIRLTRLFKNLKIRKNLNTNYSFTGWFLISRSDCVRFLDEDIRVKELFKKYYFVLSTQTISDQLKIGDKHLDKAFIDLSRRFKQP